MLEPEGAIPQIVPTKLGAWNCPMDTVKEGPQRVGVTEDTSDRVRWKKMIHCGGSSRGPRKRNRKRRIDKLLQIQVFPVSATGSFLIVSFRCQAGLPHPREELSLQERFQVCQRFGHTNQPDCRLCCARQSAWLQPVCLSFLVSALPIPLLGLPDPRP